MVMTPIPMYIPYSDEPNVRVVDLRTEGADCIPALGYSKFVAINQKPVLHYHPNCVEIVLCLKGNLILETPDGDQPFLPGLVFAVTPDLPHRLQNNPSGLTTYTLLFEIPTKRRCILGLDLRGSNWLAHSLTHLPKSIFASIPTIRTSFERLFDIYDNVDRKSPSRSVKIRAATLDLLLAVLEASHRAPTKSATGIDMIARRISAKPNAEYPIRELARETNLSVSSFALAFKRAKGLPLHAYLLNCRVNHAKELLLRTHKTITAIGQEMRFYSTQHFAKTFRRIVGINPQEFRNANRP